MNEATIFKPGDVVRVVDPNGFLVAFGKKIADRDAVVLWVDADNSGKRHCHVRVEFQKRNGRGTVFTETMQARDFVLKDAA